MTAARPVVALTLGDAAGIGPEIVARVASDPAVNAMCRPVIIGHPEVVQRAASLLRLDMRLQTVSSLAEPGPEPASIPCWNPGRDDVLEVLPGRVDARAGRAAYDYLIGATHAALAGQIDAVVTAPLSKAALHAAGLMFPGHTEILAAECGVTDVAMMLYLPPGERLQTPHGLGVAHVTLHTSIRSVPDLLTIDRIRETIRLLDRFLRSIGCTAPRIGVCALNPHAGEDGLFGDEEARVIAPAVTQCLSNRPLTLAPQAGKKGDLQSDERMDVRGPIPADALLRRAAAGEFDGVAAMYHDQGHIALKLLGFDRAVNITLGLPILRTSPSHGTAFDIAGKGIANPDGFREALRMAVTLHTFRQPGAGSHR